MSGQKRKQEDFPGGPNSNKQEIIKRTQKTERRKLSKQ